MNKKVKKTKENLSNLPSKDGNYNLFNRKGDMIYTGKGNIKERISAHKRDDDKHFTAFTYTLEPSAKKRKEIEEKRIKRYKPPLNKLYDRAIIKIEGVYNQYTKTLEELMEFKEIESQEVTELKDITFSHPIILKLTYDLGVLYGSNEEFDLYVFGSNYNEMLEKLNGLILDTLDLFTKSSLNFTESSLEYRNMFINNFKPKMKKSKQID